jgi:hypothetical protein
MQLRALPLHARSGKRCKRIPSLFLKGNREGQGERQDHV